MTRNVGLRTKLTAGFAALSVTAIVVAVVSLLTMRSLLGTVNAVAQEHARKVELAEKIQYASAELLHVENGIMLSLMSQDRAGSDRYKVAAESVMHELRRHLQQLAPLARSGENAPEIETMRAHLDSWAEAHRQLLAQLDSQQFDQLQATLANRVNPAGERMVSLASSYANTVNQQLAKAREGASERQRVSQALISALIAVAGACALVVLFVVRRSARTLAGLSRAMSGHAEQVAQSASQVRAASGSLAEVVSGQAAALQETSASAAQIQAMARKVAADMADAARRMQDSDRVVRDAGGALHGMLTAMDGIGESSGKISKIIQVIDSIAFQTNILALNAAVEAARAGAAGMGFAVVADEVRNLAHRSAGAAKETTSLIQESISRVEDGGARMTTVRQAVDAITSNSSAVTRLIADVNGGMQEQTGGIQQIAGAIERMRSMTQAYAASSQQSAAAGAEMFRQSEDMKCSARELLTLIGE